MRKKQKSSESNFFFKFIGHFSHFKVYWTDTSGKSIRRANYDGTEFEVFLSAGMEFPEGLAVDWVSRNLYWSDSGKRTIEVVNLDTKIRATVFEYLIRNPRGIAVHPSIG